jgi:hypothetical protein
MPFKRIMYLQTEEMYEDDTILEQYADISVRCKGEDTRR